jgi:hypothetical protein
VRAGSGQLTLCHLPDDTDASGVANVLAALAEASLLHIGPSVVTPLTTERRAGAAAAH